MRKFTITAAILLFVANVSYGACQSNGCYGVRVQRLYINTNYLLYIGTDGDESLLDCTALSGVYITLNPDDETFSAMYAALLAAQVAHKTVIITVIAGSSPCSVRFIALDEQ